MTWGFSAHGDMGPRFGQFLRKDIGLIDLYMFERNMKESIKRVSGNGLS